MDYTLVLTPFFSLLLMILLFLLKPALASQPQQALSPNETFATHLSRAIKKLTFFTLGRQAIKNGLGIAAVGISCYFLPTLWYFALFVFIRGIFIAAEIKLTSLSRLQSIDQKRITIPAGNQIHNSNLQRVVQINSNARQQCLDKGNPSLCMTPLTIFYFITHLLSITIILFLLYSTYGNYQNTHLLHFMTFYSINIAIDIPFSLMCSVIYAGISFKIQPLNNTNTNDASCSKLQINNGVVNQEAPSHLQQNIIWEELSSENNIRQVIEEKQLNIDSAKGETRERMVLGKRSEEEIQNMQYKIEEMFFEQEQGKNNEVVLFQESQQKQQYTPLNECTLNRERKKIKEKDISYKFMNPFTNEENRSEIIFEQPIFALDKTLPHPKPNLFVNFQQLTNSKRPTRKKLSNGLKIKEEAFNEVQEVQWCPKEFNENDQYRQQFRHRRRDTALDFFQKDVKKDTRRSERMLLHDRKRKNKRNKPIVHEEIENFPEMFIVQLQ